MSSGKRALQPQSLKMQGIAVILSSIRLPASARPIAARQQPALPGTGRLPAGGHETAMFKIRTFFDVIRVLFVIISIKDMHETELYIGRSNEGENIRILPS